MAMYMRNFTVRGRGEFPLDMLRYDCCWPQGGDDVEAISPCYETAADRKELDVRSVRLSRWVRTKREPVATNGRWDSFNWTVVKED